MVVMLKVNSLNCIELKQKELSFYMAFTVCFYVYIQSYWSLKLHKDFMYTLYYSQNYHHQTKNWRSI
jgi:hypothetical protein